MPHKVQHAQLPKSRNLLCLRHQANEKGRGNDVGEGRLCLVDLAGSERIKKSGVKGDRLREARAINSSLAALGNCIKALSSVQPRHVPYRSSRLTRILSQSLGGNAKTVLIVTLGPRAGQSDEMLSALDFGNRAMRVKVAAKQNSEFDYRALSIELQAKLDAAENKIHDLSAKLASGISNENLAAELNMMRQALAKARESAEPTSPEKGHANDAAPDSKVEHELEKREQEYAALTTIWRI